MALRPQPGVDYPRDLPFFEEWFDGDEDCRRYLAHLRWGEDGERFECPACWGRERWVREPAVSICTSCKRRTSVTAGTIFHRTRLPLLTWFRAAWLITTQKSGASAANLERLLGIAYRTAWAVLHKLRLATFRPGREPLSGDVEVDETFIGGEEDAHKGRGRLTESKEIVMVGVEFDPETHTMGRLRMARVPDFKAHSFLGFILQNIQPGSRVHTDGHQSYARVSQFGYQHMSMNLSSVPWAGGEIMPSVHRVASLVKRWWIGTHQGVMSGKHLDPYLSEFAFRFNRRTANHPGLRFYRLLQYAVQTPPRTYDDFLSRPA